MGYKALGFIVWQGGKWYLRRRTRGAPRKVAVGAVLALAVAGAVVAQRQSNR